MQRSGEETQLEKIWEGLEHGREDEERRGLRIAGGETQKGLSSRPSEKSELSQRDRRSPWKGLKCSDALELGVGRSVSHEAKVKVETVQRLQRTDE